MLTGLLLFVLVLLVLFALPLTITFNLLWERSLSGSLRIGWANNLVHTTIPLGSDTGGGDKRKPKGKDKRKKKRHNRLSVKTLLRNKPFRKRILGYLRDTWGAIEQRDLKLFMRIGLDDPADTGELWALLGPLSAILFTHRNSQISLQPDFLDQAFELQSSGTIRIVPLQHLYLTTRLLASPTIWSGIIRARRSC